MDRQTVELVRPPACDVLNPLRPLAEALRGLLDAPGIAGTAPEWLAEASRLMPELRRRFPALPDAVTPTDPGERWRLFEGVAQLILAVGASRGLPR